ncbi:uncharacterized protein LOC133421591 [Cololabis saira]|uniref:uncharacterized protein LOC133421591 n=1 Tax=Cololabis saira TaxID=129043 RepID=UPI002AD432C6|nr:uncharacterized protein LOC133421591 [Cololabis saira]
MILGGPMVSLARGKSRNTPARSYRIQTESGLSLRRNRTDLQLQPTGENTTAQETVQEDMAESTEPADSGPDHADSEISLDHESPDFVPSIFSYTKQNQDPDAKIKRYQRKKKWSERLLFAPPNQPAPAPGTPEESPAWITVLVTPEEVTSMDHSPKDIPVTRTEYNELNLRYTELKSDHVNLQEKYQQLRDENERLKEELKKSTFSYSNIKWNMLSPKANGNFLHRSTHQDNCHVSGYMSNVL